MKSLERLHWCGVILFAALIAPGLAYAGGNRSNASPRTAESRRDTDGAPLAVAPTRIAQESELTSSDYEPEAVFPPSQAHTPDAQNLLPCPLSVPCRVESDGDKSAAKSPADNVRMAEIPTPSGMQMKALLPCPMSVPCIAEPTAATAPPPVPSFRRARPQTRLRRAVRAAGTRAHHDTSHHDTSHRDAAPVRPAANVAKPVISPAPEVTLQGSSVLKLRAEHLLEQTDAKLAMINPADLAGEQAVTYEQAQRLLAAGHSALIGQDYLTALGLGSKASRLISMLPSYQAKREARAR
ncbi:MAG: hypothetical protein ACREQX_00950 [Candidatus Binataceae bacterium]